MTMPNKVPLITLKQSRIVVPFQQTPRVRMYLSNLDILPAIFGQMVQTLYFYKKRMSKTTGDFVELLKTSLAKVLVPYFPMSGRICFFTAGGRPELDCNAEGVLFREAEANVSLVELCSLDSSKDSSSIWDKFVYCPALATVIDIPPLIVQVTRLRCGGHVVGISLSHCIADGNAAIQFVNAWAQIARSGEAIHISRIKPYVDRSILKPRTPPCIDHHHPEFSLLDEYSQDDELSILAQFQSERITTDYFHISEEAVKAMKQQILTEDSSLHFITTFEAVGAHVWRCRTRALGFSGSSRSVKFIFAVDIHARIDPQLPSSYYGNAFTDACAASRARDLVEYPLCYAARLIRDAKNSITDKFVRSAIDYLEVEKPPRSENEGVDVLNASSWCRFPLNDADFGWGKPFHVGPIAVEDIRQIIFLPSHPCHDDGVNGGGLVLLLSLPMSVMPKFAELMIHETDDHQLNVKRRSGMLPPL
eukprot:PITA_01188